MKKIVFLLAAMLVLGAVPGFAKVECPMEPWLQEKANSDSYPVKAMGMMLYGIHDIAIAPVDLLYGLVEGVRDGDNPVTGLFEGLGKGLYTGAEDVVVGAYHLVGSICPWSKPVSKVAD